MACLIVHAFMRTFHLVRDIREAGFKASVNRYSNREKSTAGPLGERSSAGTGKAEREREQERERGGGPGRGGAGAGEGGRSKQSRDLIIVEARKTRDRSEMLL
jgi:hypothetical protein